jgi:signal transduction histidine kinase
MRRERSSVDERILVLPADAVDAPTASMLGDAGLPHVRCAGMPDLVAQLSGGAGTVLLGEQALVSGSDCALLAEALRGQEAWSALPVVLLCDEGAEAPAAVWAMQALHNTLVVEAPVRGATLLATLRCALGARERQYDLRDVMAEQRDTDQRKDRFLATLAHELRNPLAPLANALRIAQLPGADGSMRERALHIMERQLAILVRLVDDLLDVSRITRGKLELRRDVVLLSTILADAVETVRPLIEGSHHRLTLREPSDPVRLEADAMRLTQVFANLLDNAVRYMNPGGEIELAVDPQPAHVTVHVRDQGIGIRADAMDVIFEPFAKADAPSHARSGLGIGLTLARQLVDLHGGSISVESRGPGQGSEFRVRLPRLPEAAPAQVAAGADATATPHARILVADDNVDAAESLGLMLRLMGNEVRVAYDGPEALQEAGVFRPDVIVLDIGMPRLDGYDTARRIRQQPWGKDVLLAALSGWGQAQDKRLAAEAGFDCHFTKPVTPATLDELSTRILQRGR